MADTYTPSQRTVHQPLHPSVRPLLEQSYVEYHDEHLQFLEPDIELSSDLRTASSKFESTTSEPVEVGSIRPFDLGKFGVLVYTPKGISPTAGWPAMLGAHGGGWILGGPESEAHIWSRICRDARCVVISVGYRLAPYPAAVEDCFDALKWVMEGPAEIGIDQSCILVAGMSSGGNLAAVTTLKAVEAGLHVNLKAQILMGPVCDNTATLESETWSQRPHAPELTAKRMLSYRELYLGPRHSPTWPGEHWTASPIRAPGDLLRGCPTTTIIIGGQDLLQAEAVDLARRLQKEGVDVNAKIYERASHTFMMMDKRLPSGRQAIRYVVERVKEILVAYVEDSDIDPSDIKQERDRENLLEQAKNHWSIGQTGSDVVRLRT